MNKLYKNEKVFVGYITCFGSTSANMNMYYLSLYSPLLIYREEKQTLHLQGIRAPSSFHLFFLFFFLFKGSSQV